MSFRLNDRHKEKPAGASRRGKRTIAKEKLYKSILVEIRKIHSGFNVGVSTRTGDDQTRHWEDPYLHWSFVPHHGIFDSTLTKPHPKRATKKPT
jgi:hypothetical protein